MDERWKAVPGYEGLYEVSDAGRVRSLRRETKYRDGRVRVTQGRILRPYANWSGHLYVSLGRGNRRMIHRLVAETFLGPAPKGQVVRHLNGIPSDNHVLNLEYGTQSENLRDCYRYGRKAPNGKLSLKQVHEIRSMKNTGTRQKEVAERYGISQQSVSNIWCGRTFKDNL